jgi:hypothetical protein
MIGEARSFEPRSLEDVLFAVRDRTPRPHSKRL